jgi:hypothetical protein
MIMERTTMISVELTAAELELLITLASDQLFRREFIDPKMPGHKPDHNGITMSKTLLARLRPLVVSSRSGETVGETGNQELPPNSHRGVKKAMPV